MEIRYLPSKSSPAVINRHHEPIAFIHIDYDLSFSTRRVLDLLGERLFCGSIIVFDEIFNYPRWQQYEFKIFMEFVRSENKAIGVYWLRFQTQPGGNQDPILIATWLCLERDRFSHVRNISNSEHFKNIVKKRCN